MLRILNYVLHLDKNFGHLFHQYGNWVYLFMFLVLFAETGLVITPFLPGDTLLFAAGIFATPDKNMLSLPILLPILFLGPLCGDLCNYHIGKWVGPHLFKSDKSKIFNRKHLVRTHEFFEKYGTKTIILARWVPIVRTFAPFVAGLSEMEFGVFLPYCVLGSALWVGVCTSAGYLLGKVPFVRDNFEIAMIAMVFVTVLPIAVEGFLNSRRKKKANLAEKAILPEESA